MDTVTILAFAIVALLGAVALWGKSWLKVISYALLLAAVGWMAVSSLGTPRPYWPWGVTGGQLIAFSVDELHGHTYLWIMVKGHPIAMETPFNEQAAARLQMLMRARNGGNVMIRPGNSAQQNKRAGKGNQGRKGHLDSDSKVPFMSYPAPQEAGPPKTID